MSASLRSKVSCQICPYPILVLCLCVLSFSVAQWNQLCVRLRYLVNLLQEKRLLAAVLSLHISSVWPLSLPRGVHVSSTNAHSVFSERLFTVKTCLYGLQFLRAVFVPSLPNPVWPVVCVDSTCIHLLVYLLQESRLPVGKQSHYISSVRATVIGGFRPCGGHVFQPEEVQQCSAAGFKIIPNRIMF